MIGIRFDLLHNPGELIHAHPGLGPFTLMAETAGEIATIGDFDINFFEFFQAAKGAIWFRVV
jgi:hypothetical protein